MLEKFSGTVVHGLGKGKEFGFPTANIKLNNNELSIEKGVYAVVVNIDNQQYYGMLYVGTRPTFHLQEITIEIYFFEFNEDVYDKQISFQIVQKIRDEIQFQSTDDLIKQLHYDKEMVYIFFKHLPKTISDLLILNS
ncbi:MAG: riboflavin kinase [Bacteroidales bacterium]|jgi:riboflavin kinase/FMN adenylyltransferase|nr:riboflavin kinase [Bacteroidales bacterium]